MDLASALYQRSVIYRYIVADFILICKRKPCFAEKMEIL